MTSEILQELVDVDPKEHKLKEITKLFLYAMREWPTTNLVEISLFVEEVKKYFGEPLTIEKIKEKKFDGTNAWQLEASGSIELLIDLSFKSYNEKDFDKIVDNMLMYYKLTNTDS